MDNCLFCKIIAKKLPAKIEYQNDSFVVIQDINPQAPLHLLVIPKKHIARITEASENDRTLLGDMILCATEAARNKGVEEDFRLVLNNGVKAGQSVFHIHLHILGGRIMAWPPG